ncbi:GNAT family N-acetyltransferase [Arthrobacter sp. ISL-95]|uniref:GNAT family N-acetyltransferase n=1 Tax=Arthrobacter sp. ISL-95 TaxID=2819116 RepID=UPI001BEAAB75|nr:GNAT family N-acetyltransferase [Arthrobacter sp. ISL-95]MBT2586917.1 GNAT family N-acetyltransferase [Arthrobacter sp. ISL-95]
MPATPRPPSQLRSATTRTLAPDWLIVGARNSGRRAGEGIGRGGSSVVGWAKTHLWDYGDGPALPGHYLGGVTVRPDFRRRGIAAELTGARVQWIWERAEVAWFVVNASNHASLTLHRGFGFQEVARGPAFHSVRFDGGEGVLLRAARPCPDPRGRPSALAWSREAPTGGVCDGAVGIDPSQHEAG